MATANIDKRDYASGVKTRFNAADALIYALCTLLCLTILYPFWDVLMRSFSSAEAVGRVGLLPEKWSLGAYQAVFSQGRIWVNFLNSVIRTVGGTVLSLLVTTGAAFTLAKKGLPGRNFFTSFFVFTMFFSGGLIPAYLLVRNLNLIDTMWALILPPAANVYNMIILRNNMQSLDSSMEESAMLDGANQFMILFRIIIPVSAPILATVALWCMVGHWNAWYDALLYTNKPSLEVLQLALRNLLVQASNTELQKINALSGQSASTYTTESVRAAQTMLTMLPILVTYPFIQKYFVKGILVGSFKG